MSGKSRAYGNRLRGSDRAVEQLISAGRQQFDSDFPGENFDSCFWDVHRFHSRRAMPQNQHLYFTRYGTCDKALPPGYAEVLKSWVVLDRQSVNLMVVKTLVGRLLWEVLLERCKHRPEGFCWEHLSVEDFCQAELLALAMWAEESAYTASRYLLQFSRFLSARGICQYLYFTPQTPRIEGSSRHTLASQEKRRAKLPSQEALQGLAEIFHAYAVEPPDRLLIAALAILIVTGFRIGELLTLPVQCEVEEDRGGVQRYGLRYYKEKSRGGAKMLAVRWLTPIGEELARKAVAELRTITAPFRERALVLEQDPNRVAIPGFNWADRIRPKDLAHTLGMVGYRSLYNIPQDNLPRHRDNQGTYYLASEVETYLLSLREEHLWTLDRKDGTFQKLSETLLIAPRHFFRLINGTNPLLIQTVNYDQISLFLVGHKGGLSRSAFERFGVKEQDGSFCRLTPHQFRHWLNDVADKGGLPVELQTRWLGREHARDAEGYRHATVEERLQWVKEGIRNGQIGGVMADVYFRLPAEERDVFLEGQVQAVHFTALGLCLHDFSIEPCPFHLNCTRRCRDYLRRKGNQEERRNLIQIQRQTKKALVLAQEQLATGNAVIAEPWVRHYQETLEGIESALAIDEDPHIAEGTIVEPFKEQPSRFRPFPE